MCTFLQCQKCFYFFLRKLYDNPLTCDCNLAWLPKWFAEQRGSSTKGRPNIEAKCSMPLYLRGRQIAELSQRELKCGKDSFDDDDGFLLNDGVTGGGNGVGGQCTIKPLCPFACTCIEKVVDCRNRNLTQIPDYIPEDAVEM